MKTLEEARANFVASAALIPERYKLGVSRADWSGKAASDQAEANYAAAMTKALSQKSRQTGVKKVSNADWQNAAITKGGAVIGTRIRESEEKWATKFGPIYQAVQADIGRLPGRTTDAMQNIDARLKPTVKSWQKHAGKA